MNIEKVYNISFIFLFSLCALFSCTEKYDINEASSTNDAQTSLIIQEAKEFFANNYAAYAYARSGGKTDANKYLNPGDFTPMWEKSVVSQNAGYVNVDVPIISQNRFRVLRSEIRNGQAQAYKVVVTQRLVISKDIESGKQLSYLMNFIPDRKYYAQNKGNVGNHVTSLGKEDFSGLIVYALCPGNYPFKIESCKDKNSTAVTMPLKKGIVGEKFEKMFGCMRVEVSHAVQTRFEDDWWDDNWGDDNWGDDYGSDDYWDDMRDAFYGDTDTDLDWWIDKWEGETGTDYDDDDSSVDETFGPEGECTNGDDPYLPILLEVYHNPCNTYLGTVNPENSPGKATFYCKTCKVDVVVYY